MAIITNDSLTRDCLLQK